MLDSKRHTLMMCLLLAACAAAAAEPAAPAPGFFSFAPNQLAANHWYRPGALKQLINGHLDDSFGRGAGWDALARNLGNGHGSFSVMAAEIGHLSCTTGLVPFLKAKGIPVSVEVPGFTQALDGAHIGKAELFGEPVNGTNLFTGLFGIHPAPERYDPSGAGWFVTHDAAAFVPDELLLDERVPNLLPEFDWAMLAQTPGDWAARKNAARRSMPFATARQPFERLMSSLMQDYVGYLSVAKARWGDRMPAVCPHWNVNPAWEWRDERGLDAINEKDPAFFAAPDGFTRIVSTTPQYHSVRYLEQLIGTLAAAGFTPRTVFMDVDWTYDVPYLTEVLKRHKASLRPLGVQMGINVVEASIGDQEELFYDGRTLTVRKDVTTPPNVLYERTLTAIMKFLIGSGIYEQGMHIRVGSWSHRPQEVGAQIDEATPGSMAHAANEVFELLPRR
jgi:hypothetical protein